MSSFTRLPYFADIVAKVVLRLQALFSAWACPNCKHERDRALSILSGLDPYLGRGAA